jgi:hypothetical protein
MAMSAEERRVANMNAGKILIGSFPNSMKTSPKKKKKPRKSPRNKMSLKKKRQRNKKNPLTRVNGVSLTVSTPTHLLWKM